MTFPAEQTEPCLRGLQTIGSGLTGHLCCQRCGLFLAETPEHGGSLLALDGSSVNTGDDFNAHLSDVCETQRSVRAINNSDDTK